MRAAFAGIVDYAGLFPPASCSMADAISAYNTYRQSPDRWMLGRFIVAASRLDEMASALGASGIVGASADPWQVSAVLGSDIPAEVARVNAFRSTRRAGDPVIDSIECKVTTPEHVGRADAQLPDDLIRHLEVPMDGPYSALVAAIGRIGAHAKVRTGGTTPDLIPAPEDLIAFLIAAVAHRVPFKATAGLHHPFRGTYALSYAPDADRAMMYGFVNLLVATAELVRSGDSADAQDILEEHDPSAFEHGSDAITWRGRRYGDDALGVVRNQYFRAFGSCSFREPVDELALGQPA